MSPWIAALIGLLAGSLLASPSRHSSQHRRTYLAKRCTRHGIFNRQETCCPECGGELVLISVVQLRPRRRRRIEPTPEQKAAERAHLPYDAFGDYSEKKGQE